MHNATPPITQDDDAGPRGEGGAAEQTASLPQIERLIGTFPAADDTKPAGRPGPRLVVAAALHGNEPAGIHAARNVLDALRTHTTRDAFTGTLTAVIGNTRALARGVRFIHEDLNRHWTPAHLARLENLRLAASDDDHAPLLAEDRELLGLREAVLDAVHPGGPSSREPRGVLVDLHTTSSDTHPFLYTEDRGPTRRIARALPIISCLGGEPHLRGLFADWFNEHIGPALIFESARHDDPRAVELHEAAIWLALDHLRMIDRSTFAAQIRRSRRMLRELDAHDPRFLEIRHRHPVVEGDRFRMKPGFNNFARVRVGQHLADDKAGAIRAPRSGRVFMPLYQAQGEDGFFIVNPMTRAFLSASLLARALRLHTIAHLLPGVRRVGPADTHAFAADTHIARIFRRQVFALLGFRRHAKLGDTVVFARTPTDLQKAVRALKESRGDGQERTAARSR